MLSILCVAAGPAAAHPHVFIENVVTFVFTGGKLSGLRLLWAFDEVYSQSLFEDFDTNHDGNFDPAEVALAKKTSLTGLKPYGYFTHLWVDGKSLKAFDATDLRVSSQGSTVIYDMQIALAKPLDPRHNKVEVAVFDDSYYIDVELHEAKPVLFQGLTDGSCQYKITDDTTRAYYYNSVYPQVIELVCKG